MSGAAAAAGVLDHLVGVGGAVWRASWQASVLALLVVAIQLAFGRRISARWRHAMWMLVLVRLALPVVPSSPVSVFNLAPGKAPVVRAAPVETGIGPIAWEAPVEAVSPLAASRTNMPRSATPQAAKLARSAPDLWTGWPQVLATLWALGAIVFVLRIARATWRVSRSLRRLDLVVDDSVHDVLRATAVELGVRRLPKLLAGDGLFSPALVGCVRPKLLVPRDLLASFDERELRLVFLHELAHLKRGDVAINWAATLLTVLHWMNPIVWLVTWRLRLERELACDELVMSRASDTDRRAYGHTIVKLLETFSRSARPLPAGGVGILEGKGQMKRRIIMIAQFAKSSRTWTIVAACLVLTLALVALTDAVQAEEPAPPATRPADIRQEVIETADGKRIATDNYVRTTPTDTNRQWARDSIRNLESTRAAKVSKLGEDHPEIRALDEQIAAMKAVLNTERVQHAQAKIQPGDLVAVSVMNLAGEGVETTRTARVDADGNLRLPLGHVVKAAGLTSVELEREVAKNFNTMVAVSLPERGESHQLAARREAAGLAADGALVAWNQGFEDVTVVPGMARDPLLAPLDDATKAVLAKKLPEVKLENIPLSDVIDSLRELTGANIFVNWRALEAAGIDKGSPVSINVRDVAFKDVLALVLREQGGGLAYKVENGVILLDVPAQPAKAPKLVTKAYDVADLLAAAQGLEGQGLFGGGGASPMPELTKTIYEAVAPESWRSQGGQGSLSTYGSKVVVTASDDVHRDVVNLLDMLRDKPQSKPATKPAEPGAVH